MKTKLLFCILLCGLVMQMSAQSMDASPQGNSMFINIEAQKVGDNTSINNGNVYLNLNRSNDQDQTLIRFNQNFHSNLPSQVQVTATWELGLSNGDIFGLYHNNPNYTNPYFPALTVSPNTNYVGIGTDQFQARLNVLNTLYGGDGLRSIAQSTGVYGESTGSLAVASFGVHGVGNLKAGVYGESSESHGVYGNINDHPEESNGTAGVYGEAAHGGNYGVMGKNPEGIGVYGDGQTYGVYGFSEGIGVHGVTKSAMTNSFGVRGEAVSGIGVKAYSSNNNAFEASIGNSNYYAGYFTGDVYTTASYLPSDRKLKQNEHTISNALQLIDQLQPKSYDYRCQEFVGLNLPQGTRYGFIAQEIGAIFPQFTKTTQQIATGLSEHQMVPQVEFEAVNYIELIPILTKAIQELNQKVMELEIANSELSIKLQSSMDLKYN